MSEPITPNEIKRLFPNGVSASTIARNSTAGVSPAAKLKPNPGDEPARPDAGEAADKTRRLVRVTSHRLCLCDERNLWDKHFIDALVEAGILYDDSPQYAQIEVAQVKVERKELERTEITIEKL